MKAEPYLVLEIVRKEYRYNPNYGDTKVCACRHQYQRHFDTHEDMENVGCKYCECLHFTEIDVWNPALNRIPLGEYVLINHSDGVVTIGKLHYMDVPHDTATGWLSLNELLKLKAEAATKG